MVSDVQWASPLFSPCATPMLSVKIERCKPALKMAVLSAKALHPSMPPSFPQPTRFDLPITPACVPCPPTRDLFLCLRRFYSKSAFPNQSFFAGDRLLLVLADVSGQLEPFSFVCFAFVWPVRFTSFFYSQEASVLTYPIHVQLPLIASTLHSLPMQTLGFGAFVSNLHLCSLLAQPLRALATDLLSTRHFSFDKMISSFSSHRRRQVSFKFIFLSSGEKQLCIISWPLGPWIFQLQSCRASWSSAGLPTDFPRHCVLPDFSHPFFFFGEVQQLFAHTNTLCVAGTCSTPISFSSENKGMDAGRLLHAVFAVCAQILLPRTWREAYGMGGTTLVIVTELRARTLVRRLEISDVLHHLHSLLN